MILRWVRNELARIQKMELLEVAKKPAFDDVILNRAPKKKRATATKKVRVYLKDRPDYLKRQVATYTRLNRIRELKRNPIDWEENNGLEAED